MERIFEVDKSTISIWASVLKMVKNKIVYTTDDTIRRDTINKAGVCIERELHININNEIGSKIIDLIMERI